MGYDFLLKELSRYTIGTFADIIYRNALLNPDREAFVPGYLLRAARETAGLTQSQLAAKLGVTQQAIARAENWNSNPTVGLMNRWARECGRRLELRLLG